MHLLDMHPADNRQEAEEIFTAMFKGERESCPLPLITKSGMFIPVETRIWFGQWNGEECIFGISKDLTSEQDAQQRFERLFRNNPALMAISTLPERRFLDINDAFLKSLGYDREDIVGKTAEDIALFVHQEQLAAAANKLRADGRIVGFELQVRHKDGAILDGLFSGEVISNQGRQYFLTVMIDITERKRAEKALRQAHDTLEERVEQRTGELQLSRQQLRELYSRMQTTQEKDRKQISREIHDELGTVLTVLKYDLAWVERKLTNPSSVVVEKINTMSATVDSIIETIQKICAQLRPSLLDDMGLAAAIEWQSSQFAKMAGFICKTNLDENIDLDQDYSTVLFRIFQELLTNILRHAQADTVQIRLKQQNRNIFLEVEDNGIGINKEQILNLGSLGLIGIRERVTIYDGSFVIKGSHGKGTIATVIIPIDKKGSDNDKDTDM
jgi:PAS domain S-box-containing protein